MLPAEKCAVCLCDDSRQSGQRSGPHDGSTVGPILTYKSPSYTYRCFECDLQKNHQSGAQWTPQGSLASVYCNHRPCGVCGHYPTRYVDIPIRACTDCAVRLDLSFRILAVNNTTHEEYPLTVKYSTKLRAIFDSLKYREWEFLVSTDGLLSNRVWKSTDDYCVSDTEITPESTILITYREPIVLYREV
jgi:hypothetical protein